MPGIERPMPPAEPAPPPTAERIPFGRAQWLAPGMTIRKAKLGGGDLLYLLQLPGGLTTVPHGHVGLEFTAVLEGAYDDESGHFAAGDFAEMTDEIDHQPSVAAGQLIRAEQFDVSGVEHELIKPRVNLRIVRRGAGFVSRFARRGFHLAQFGLRFREHVVHARFGFHLAHAGGHLVEGVGGRFANGCRKVCEQDVQ